MLARGKDLLQPQRHLPRVAVVVEAVEHVAGFLRGLVEPDVGGSLRGVADLTLDGRIGWPEHAPYDAIVVTAGAPALVEELKAQLAPGGTLVAPVGGANAQGLLRVRKDMDGNISEENIAQVVFVPGGIPPHKEASSVRATAEDRLAMVEAAVFAVTSVRNTKRAATAKASTQPGTPASSATDPPIQVASPLCSMARASESPPPKSTSTSQGILRAVSQSRAKWPFLQSRGVTKSAMAAAMAMVASYESKWPRTLVTMRCLATNPTLECALSRVQTPVSMSGVVAVSVVTVSPLLIP